MFRIVVLTFAVFVLNEVCAKGETPKINCPGNEVWTYDNKCKETCGGHDCPNIKEEGCFCPPGHRRKEGKCIAMKECAHFLSGERCKKDQDWRKGNACENECGKTWRDCDSLLITEGCFCKDGYKMNHKQCVLEGDCFKKKPACGENEEWRVGNPCQEQCGEYECGDAGFEDCFCINGYARNIDKKCVPEGQC